MFFDRIERESVVDSILASPLESGFEFLDAVGHVPLRSSEEPRQGTDCVKR